MGPCHRPLARIILIRASNASTASLLGAINPPTPWARVISMSFGAAEGSWTSSVDSAFTRTNMTYMAATGDSGTGVGVAIRLEERARRRRHAPC